MTTAFSFLVRAVPAALVALLVAAPLSGQMLRGLVIEHGENAAIPGAVVTLMDETFATRASTITDEEGLFTFADLAAGRYMLQAEFGGLLSALSEAVEIEAADETVEVVLALPSTLVMQAGHCAADQRAGFGVLVGIVRDANTEVALPAGRVTFRWQSEGRRDQVETVTDAGGRYHVCSLPVGVPITANVQAFGRGAVESQFMLPEAPLSRQDFLLGLRTRTAAEVQRGPMRGSAADPGTLVGRLVDLETRQPIAGAVVSLVGTSFQELTDAQGRFRFDGLTPRSYTLHVQHLGYGRQSEAIEVPGGTDVSLTLRLNPQAIALEGVTVRARSAADEMRRRSPTAFRGLAGADLRLMEARGAQVLEALRERVAGLTIVEGDFDTPDGRSPICVMASRRNATFQTPGATGQRPYCPMVTVFMDNVRIFEPGTLLRGLSVSEFESVEFLTPLDGGIRFGLDAANGVLVLHSRGRGPMRDAARN